MRRWLDCNADKLAAVILTGPAILKGQSVTEWAVSLVDGHFEHDGAVFWDSATFGKDFATRSLIMGRRTRIPMVVSATVEADGTVTRTQKQGEPVVWFTLGWSGITYSGETFTSVIEFE